MLRLQPILYVSSLLLLALSACMLVPALADLVAGSGEWQAFVGAGAATATVGGALLLANRGTDLRMGVREAFLMTASCWGLTSAFGALPFVFAPPHLSYTDAVFETVSGLTTTGSTVMVGLDRMAPGILLWRALLQWIGGVGIIVMAVAILPFLRVGGMQLFRSESSDRTDQLSFTLATFARLIVTSYIVLTLLCVAVYWSLGMTPFEAVCHAMSTLSTGGFSTSDSSIGFFHSPAIEWAAIVFMLAGALPFVLYARALKGFAGDLVHDTQVQSLLLFLLLVSAAGAVMLYESQPDLGIEASFRTVAFNVVSVVTTTGFASADYNRWGGWAQALFFLLTFVGGCSGSTAGGIKIFRFQVMGTLGRLQLLRLRWPNGVFPLLYGGRKMAPDVPTAVAAFILLYISCFGFISLALTALGLDFVTAISASATAISNVGPGLGDLVGPAGNFAMLPAAAKWLLALGMLLGRLELLTLLVLLMPAFWRA